MATEPSIYDGDPVGEMYRRLRLSSKRCARGVHRDCTGYREVKMQPLPCGCACHPRCRDCNEPMPTRTAGTQCHHCLNVDLAFPGRHHTTDEEWDNMWNT